MRQNIRSFWRGPWGCGVAVVWLSALVGIWNAKNPQAATSSRSPIQNVARTSDRQTSLERIEATLAQAGCPGWIVLASEGEAALEPPTKLVPSDARQTALRVTANPPRISYPTPLYTASRTLFAPPPNSGAHLAAGATDDPNDLLDGTPDLLATPPIDPPAPTTSTPTAPGESASADGHPTKQSPPATPSPEEPIFPDPNTPSEEPPKELPPLRVPPAAATEQPFAPSAPPKPAPQKPAPQKPAPQKPAPQKPAPRKPAPQKPAPRKPAPRKPAPRKPAPRKIEQPEPIEAPTAVPDRQPSPQSPFSPPPVPSQPAPHSTGNGKAITKTHCEFVAEENFPSAQACAKCHEKIFDEWSVSSHAYASISPMFHKFEQKINDISQGTVGYFCYRCHAPVGTTLGVSRAAPLWELPLVAREGVTCVACHRVNQRYGKVNGERRIEPGNIHAPVYGSIGGSGVAEVIAKQSEYKVKTSTQDRGPGQDIHVAGECFDQLSKAEFCMSCHQVAVQPGIKLEVVWEQYRASPACKKGISCQDCHMGRIPGVPSGYEVGAAAKVGDKVVNSRRKHANHVFYGPGYSIAHPGIFPHNIDANRWSMQDWLLFDWRAGWGTEKFEQLLEAGHIRAAFPPVWAEVDDRFDAREIIDDNLKKLDAKKISRMQILENGSHVDGPFFDTQLVHGQDLKFHFVMSNTNDGHNLPSGSLGAQPQLWANVALIGPRGQRLWESGYTDRWGDVADIHSEDVRQKLIPYDWQLFNLQTMFLITGAKGTDREFFLPVNIDIDQLPFLRPGAQPISVLNHPPFIRMEGRSLAPLGSREIPYKVPAKLICEPGHYRLSFRLRSRAEPIYFMRFCGSTQEMNRAMNEGIVDFHQSSVEFFVK